MSFSNTNQVNKLFPGLDKIMQGYAGSLNGEASVYGHSQPAGPSASTTQECVFSPASSSMALFAHHTQAAANPNHIAALASVINQVSHGATNGSQNLETDNQMVLSGSQGRHTLPPDNQPARHRRKLITPEKAQGRRQGREQKYHLIVCLARYLASIGARMNYDARPCFMIRVNNCLTSRGRER
ncbi:hypothetical protein DSO57_1017387 [Entomophthora muscae]|uniref:Uncharacterized protein n=1 Tax=Entomophthora muscae TaxID=34485 RepID=A0ACC2STB7_9FUNG|nr:hypothetical protein DSO57_1017387 [Entomophthora muscae]